MNTYINGKSTTDRNLEQLASKIDSLKGSVDKLNNSSSRLSISIIMIVLTAAIFILTIEMVFPNSINNAFNFYFSN